MSGNKSVFSLVGWVLFFALGYLFGVKGVFTEEKAEIVNDIDSIEARAQTTGMEEEYTIPDRKLNNEEQATISLFEAATPSVVFINTSEYRSNYWTRDITEIPRGSGSGFVWDEDGHIVTNYHVIQNADRATVTLADQTTWDADLVGYAPEKDLAILKIDAPRRDLVPIPVGTSIDLMVGQSVYAIGNPFGLDQTLTTGIISALGREIKSRTGVPIRDVIQTDAAINPGNSGGPLLDSQGKLIGVNTAIYSPSGAYAGIGFSIPVDQVNWVVPDLIEYGRLMRPALGADLWNQTYVSRAGIEGAVIWEVQPGSAAERAGLKSTTRTRRGDMVIGDIIVKVGDEPIKNNADLQLALEKYKVGEEIEVTVIRQKEEVKTTVVLDPPR